MQQATRLPWGCTRGFTIIEVIVAIGVVAVLLSILVPVASNARTSAIRSVQATKLQQLGQVIMIYAAQWDDTYPMADTVPHYGTGPATDAAIASRGTPWYTALADAGVATVEEIKSTDHLDIRNSLLSKSYLHHPDIFVPGKVIPALDRVVHPIRTTDVSFPAQKGHLTVHRVINRGRSDQPWCCSSSIPGPVVFSDLSVTTVSWIDLRKPDFPRTGDIGIPVRSTWFGVRGIDR